MSDRTVLITGATSGIGYETALALASQGARVLITGRNPSRGEEAIAAIRRQAGHQHVEFLAADHSTVGANQEVAREARALLASLDVLINNVGRVFSHREETADGYEATLALCFVGPVALTQELLPVLQASGRSRIVNVASSAYKMWRGDQFDDVQSRQQYVGIKAHARAKLLNIVWTFALAQQLEGTGLTVNAINPGAAWTAGTEQLTPEAVPAWKHVWPIVRFFQRRASAEKAARTPIWLASAPEAGRLNGTYVEKHKPQRPKVASDPENQRRVSELAQDLVQLAPTRRPQNPSS